MYNNKMYNKTQDAATLALDLQKVKCFYNLNTNDGNDRK